MAWKGYHFRLPTSVNVHYDFFMALKAFIVAAGWELYDSFGLTKAIWTLTTTSTFTDAETISIDGKVYTIKTTLTPTEGQVLRGGSASITLDNLKSAINHTGTPGTDYSCAAAHPTVTATTKTATSLVIQAIADGDANNTNSMAVTETCNQASFAQTAGVDNTVVYRSRGESGLEPYGYICLVPTTTLIVYAYQYWNSGTHTGTRAATMGSVGNFTLSAFSATQDCLIAGDKDLIYMHVFFNSASSSSYSYGVTIGHFPKRAVTDMTTTTGAIVAGSNVSIPVADSSKVPGPNGYFQILGLSEGCDLVQTASIPDGTHVIVKTLPRNYASGAFLGQPASTFGFSSSINSASDNHWRPVSYFSDAGLTVSATTYGLLSVMALGTISTLSGKQVLTPYYLLINGGTLLGYIDKGLFYLSVMTHWDTACTMNDGSITITNILATSGATLSITDSTKSWTPHAYIGKFVVIVGGTGVGQVRKITENDATSLTIGFAWTINPDATTTFRIYDTVYRVNGTFPGFSNSGAFLITDTSIPA